MGYINKLIISKKRNTSYKETAFNQLRNKLINIKDLKIYI